MNPLIPLSSKINLAKKSNFPIKVAIFGSTGSIGQTTLSIIREHPEKFIVTALVAGTNKSLLEKQVEEFKVKEFGLASNATEIAKNADYDLMIAGIVGVAGLSSVYQAALRGKKIALANKESLVCGGKILSKAIIDNNAEIYPIDSEHSAIWQSLIGNNLSDVTSVILAASGGPFLNKSKEELKLVTLEQALKHPKWSMGAKVTIDSSTLFNKALEVIEAKWLFGLSEKQVEVIVHPEHIIHSLVRYNDGSLIMQACLPDMRVCIGYALGFPVQRLPNMANQIDLAQISKFNFLEVDNSKFPSIMLARKMLNSIDETASCTVFNAADEIAVEKFKNSKINWDQIYPFVESATEKFSSSRVSNIDDIFELDTLVRKTLLED